MVNNMSSEQQLINGFLGKSTELFASEIPFYFARGNHETRGNFSDHYLDYFPTSTNEPYYAFRQGPVFLSYWTAGRTNRTATSNTTDWPISTATGPIRWLG